MLFEDVLQHENQSLPEVDYQLGLMYELGVILPMDREKAIACYESAARQGHESAANRLTYLRNQGSNAYRPMILVCDDDPNVTEILSRALPSYDVFRTHNVDECEVAIKASNEGTFDILVLDYLINQTTGLALYRSLQDKAIPLPKALLLTGYSDPKVLEEAHELGFVKNLIKPVSLSTLDGVIRQLMHADARGPEA